MGPYSLQFHTYITGTSASKHGPQWAPPISAFMLSALPFVFVVGPLQAWSHHGHKRAGRRHRCGWGSAHRGPGSHALYPVYSLGSRRRFLTGGSMVAARWCTSLLCITVSITLPLNSHWLWLVVCKGLPGGCKACTSLLTVFNTTQQPLQPPVCSCTVRCL